MRAVLVVVLVLLPAVATAQPGLTAPQPLPEPVPQIEPIKSESTAQALALGGTAAGWVVMYAAAKNESAGLAWAGVGLLAAGPSLGHFYAGETGMAMGSSLLRGLGIGGMVLGIVVLANSDGCDDLAPCNDDGESRAELLLLGGAGVYLATTIWDIVDSKRAARRANERHRSLSVMPSVMASGGGHAPAISLSGRF